MGCYIDRGAGRVEDVQRQAPPPQIIGAGVYDRLRPFLRGVEGDGGGAAALLVIDLRPVLGVDRPPPVGLPLHLVDAPPLIIPEADEAAAKYVDDRRRGGIPRWERTSN